MSTQSNRKWIITWAFILVITFFLFFHRVWNIPWLDFLAYYQAGQRALSGENLYVLESTPFKYFPFISYLFVPFGLLPYTVSKVIFFLLNYSLAVLIYRKIILRYGHWVAFVLFLSFVRFHNHDFLNLQVNHILLFLFLVFLEQFKVRQACSALCFSVLGFFKVMPFVIGLPLLLQKKWKFLLLTFLCVVVFLLLPVLTFQDGVGIYAQWVELMKKTTPFPAPPGGILQSVQGAYWYYFGPRIAVESSYLILMGIQVGLIGLLGVSFFKFKKMHLKHPEILYIAALSLSVVISPLAWKHGFLLLFPAVLLLLERGLRRPVIIQFLMLTVLPTLLSFYSKDWADRSYLTMLGGLFLYFYFLFQLPKSFYSIKKSDDGFGS